VLAALVGCAPGAPAAAPPAATSKPASEAKPTAQAAPATQAAPAAQAAPVAPASQARGEIVFSTFADAEETAIFQAIIDAYKAHNPNVTVNLNVVPNQSDFLTKLSAAFTAGTPRDVFLTNYRRLAQFSSKNAIQPLDAHLAASPTLKR
jgi:ABC-type glycerol-3-phosphate transport system substrate-binding protein